MYVDRVIKVKGILRSSITAEILSSIRGQDENALCSQTTTLVSAPQEPRTNWAPTLWLANRLWCVKSVYLSLFIVSQTDIFLLFYDIYSSMNGRDVLILISWLTWFITYWVSRYFCYCSVSQRRTIWTVIGWDDWDHHSRVQRPTATRVLGWVKCRGSPSWMCDKWNPFSSFNFIHPHRIWQVQNRRLRWDDSTPDSAPNICPELTGGQRSYPPPPPLPGERANEGRRQAETHRLMQPDCVSLRGGCCKASCAQQHLGAAHIWAADVRFCMRAWNAGCVWDNCVFPAEHARLCV